MRAVIMMSEGIIDVEEFRNFKDKLVGYSIIGKIEVK